MSRMIKFLVVLITPINLFCQNCNYHLIDSFDIDISIFRDDTLYKSFKDYEGEACLVFNSTGGNDQRQLALLINIGEKIECITRDDSLKLGDFSFPSVIMNSPRNVTYLGDCKYTSSNKAIIFLFKNNKGISVKIITSQLNPEDFNEAELKSFLEECSKLLKL